MDTRLFSVTPEFFNKEIKPLIEDSYIWKGRPPTAEALVYGLLQLQKKIQREDTRIAR